MDIAILGGTGDIGRGLALRLALDTDHRIRIGSRDAPKAEASVDRYRERLSSHGADAVLSGSTNEAAAAGADVVILAVPPVHVRDLLDGIEEPLDEDAILVTPAVGMTRTDDGMRYDPPGVGSLTALIADHAPASVSVIGAFHTLSAHRLADLDADLGFDTLVVGDDPSAKDAVMELADEIDGLRAVDAGGTGNAAEVEAVTPLLINVARENEALRDLGIRFV